MIYARRAFLVPRALLRAILGFAVATAAAGGVWAGPTEPLPERVDLCRRIDRALAHARDGRRLDASVQGAWQIVHGVLAFGPDFPLDARGTTSSALDYLLGGGRATGWKLRAGSVGVAAEVEPGSTMGQGHPDQWLGYLSQCGVAADGQGTPAGIPLDTPLQVGGRSFTVRDLLAQAQHDIRPGQEATWTLMALSHWLPPDAAWTAGDGEAWTTERVVRMEARADVPSAACGGAHRLYGLATAVAASRRATGRDPEGGWGEAESVLDHHLDRARRFQQPDGSFAVRPFERPGTSPDVFARLSATGHAFEVLAVALDDTRLAEPWVTRAADRLVTLLETTADLDVECGALYHAVHGLAIYRDRVCPAR
ncbi:MAG: hypothetical protein ACKO40_00235 [Planctomycetaceae bacterium]